jgi:hypothetical protein
MSSKTFQEAYKTDMLAFWHDVTKIRTPVWHRTTTIFMMLFLLYSDSMYVM